MVNAINDKKLFNSMEIDRKMKYQSLRFPKSSSQRRTVSSWIQARNYFALRQTIFHTGLRKDFTRRNKYSSANRSHAFYREASWLFQGHWNQLTRSDDHSQSYSLFSDSLGPSGVRDGNLSDVDLKLRKLNKQMVIVSKVF